MLRWIDELEHDKCSSSYSVQGALGGCHVNCKIIPSLCTGGLPGHCHGWMALLDWSVIALSSFGGLVHAGYLLYEKLVGMLDLVNRLLLRMAYRVMVLTPFLLASWGESLFILLNFELKSNI